MWVDWRLEWTPRWFIVIRVRLTNIPSLVNLKKRVVSKSSQQSEQDGVCCETAASLTTGRTKTSICGVGAGRSLPEVPINMETSTSSSLVLIEELKRMDLLILIEPNRVRFGWLSSLFVKVWRPHEQSQPQRALEGDRRCYVGQIPQHC